VQVALPPDVQHQLVLLETLAVVFDKEAAA